MGTITLLAISVALVFAGASLMARADEPEIIKVPPAHGTTGVGELPPPALWRPGDPITEGPPRRGTQSQTEEMPGTGAQPAAAPPRPAGGCDDSRN